MSTPSCLCVVGARARVSLFISRVNIEKGGKRSRRCLGGGYDTHLCLFHMAEWVNIAFKMDIYSHYLTFVELFQSTTKQSQSKFARKCALWVHIAPPPARCVQYACMCLVWMFMCRSHVCDNCDCVGYLRACDWDCDVRKWERERQRALACMRLLSLSIITEMQAWMNGLEVGALSCFWVVQRLIQTAVCVPGWLAVSGSEHGIEIISNGGLDVLGTECCTPTLNVWFNIYSKVFTRLKRPGIFFMTTQRSVPWLFKGNQIKSKTEWGHHTTV